MKFKIFFLVVFCLILFVVVVRQNHLIKVPKEDRQIIKVEEEIIRSKVEKVISGNSFLMDDGVEIRLFGIDAPEIGQICITESEEPDKDVEIPCGENSKKKLESLIQDAEINCIISGRDAIDRMIGDCEVETRNIKTNRVEHININKEMVATGNAIAYTQMGDKYVEDENKAKQAGLGIWATTFESPSEYRRMHRKF